MRMLPRVLKLDMAGNPLEMISYEESAYHYAKGNVAWSTGTINYELKGGINSITGKRSTLAIDTIIAIKGGLSKKAMEHYRRVPLTNRLLFKRDKRVCAYCGEIFPEKHLTRDHIHPTSKGGKNVWTNVVTACERCNHTKGSFTLEEMQNNISLGLTHMKLLYIPYAPNKAEELILNSRNILEDQMTFLIKQVPKNSRLLN